MANSPDVSAKIDQLVAQYDIVLKMCYDALAADTPQENRDALRTAISEHFDAPDSEE